MPPDQVGVYDPSLANFYGDYSMQETAANPFSPSDSGLGGLLTPGGILSKVADTALDVYALQQRARLAPPGTVYPSGQVNPASATARTGAANPYAPSPLMLAGIAAVVGIVVIIAVLRK